MKLEVPFHTQSEANDCGPAALKMVFEYLGEKHDKDKLKEWVSSETSGITWTLGLAKAAAQLGFKVELYSTSLGFNPGNFELEFYQKQTDGAQSAEANVNKLRTDCLKFGVKLEERSFAIKEILSKISKDCIPIVLLDWGIVKNLGRFAGHFVPIAGYDENFVYVHNGSSKAPAPYFQLNMDLFERARKSKGTDEDIVFVYRKK